MDWGLESVAPATIVEAVLAALDNGSLLEEPLGFFFFFLFLAFEVCDATGTAPELSLVRIVLESDSIAAILPPTGR